MTTEFFDNRAVAAAFAAKGQRQFSSAFKSLTQLEPGKGHVAILMSTKPLPEAIEQGFEVQVRTATEPKAAPKVVAKPTAPTGKVTDVIEALHAKTPLTRADRKKIIDACVAKGFKATTASSTWAKWAKDNKIG